MGWLIAFGVTVLLAALPLGVMASYDAGGPLVRLIAGPFRVTLVPGRKKQKQKKEPKQKEEKPARTAAGKPGNASGGKLTDFLPLVQVVWDFLADFGRKLRVNRLELKLILAGDDPCDLAVNYGRASAALGGLVSQLERFFVIKKRDMQVECDFTADQTLVTARLDLTITIGRLFSMGVRHGIRGLREILKIMKSRKGGAVK